MRRIPTILLLILLSSIFGYAYTGDMVFTRSTQGTYSFESVAYSNGRIEASENIVRRYVTDHLGNVRAIVTGDNVLERNDYYPFGGRHQRNTLPMLSSNRWRLGAKETQPPATGSLVDFGARMYDPHTGRWTTQDPMAWKYVGMSPYNYCGNDPVNLVDPDGNIIETLWDIVNVAADIESLASNIEQHNIGASIVDGVGLVLDLAAAIVPVVPGGVGTAIKAVRNGDKIHDAGRLAIKSNTGIIKNAPHTYSSNAARREVMRKQGIPTSQQPISQSINRSGREYRYDVPDSYGRTKQMSVQQETLDRNHPGEKHWEGGEIKEGNRSNAYGWP